jgi:amino acid permease
MNCRLLPASALMLGLGLFSAYTFQLYGRLAHETQATTLGETWERTIGEKSSWVISAGTFSFCFGLALVYALVIGDFLSSLAMSFGSSIPAVFAKRQFWILSVTLSTLYPLCNLKSLAALAPMSMIGTAGTLLTTIFMAVRCPSIVPSSPYSVTPGAVGAFASTLAPSLAPRFGSFYKIISPAALIIMSMSTTAYLGHFNAPDLYHGFKSETEDSVSETNEKAIKRYNKMTAFGFIGSTLMNIIIMALGFLTFGGNSAGVVLNNYATADKGAVMSRLLMTLSVIGGYPFMVGGCKSNFVQLYNKFKKGTWVLFHYLLGPNYNSRPNANILKFLYCILRQESTTGHSGEVGCTISHRDCYSLGTCRPRCRFSS